MALAKKVTPMTSAMSALSDTVEQEKLESSASVAPSAAPSLSALIGENQERRRELSSSDDELQSEAEKADDTQFAQMLKLMREADKQAKKEKKDKQSKTARLEDADDVGIHVVDDDVTTSADKPSEEVRNSDAAAPSISDPGGGHSNAIASVAAIDNASQMRRRASGCAPSKGFGDLKEGGSETIICAVLHFIEVVEKNDALPRSSGHHV